MKVALITSAIASQQEGFIPLYMRSMDALSKAFHSIGREAQIVLWNDSTIDWSQFEAALVTSTWDYFEHFEEFMSVMEKVARKTTLFNDLKTIKWNSQKTYLFELEKEGVSIIPTKFIEHLTEKNVEECFEDFATDELVLKPMIGANGEGQFRMSRQSKTSSVSTTVSHHGWLVQPFQDSILDQGELSLIYFGGEFSHAVRKCPRKGEYRVQSEYGGTDEEAIAPKDAAEISKKILDLVPVPPLFGRIDLVRLNSGQLGIMECEFVEPYLYPEYCPDFAQSFGDAYLKQIEGTRKS